MIKVDALLRRYYILDCIDPQIYHYGDYFYTYSSYCNVVEGKFVHKTIPDTDADGKITINLPVVFSKVLRLQEPYHLHPSVELFLPSLKYIGRSHVYYYVHLNLLQTPESSIHDSSELKSKQAFFNQIWRIGNSSDLTSFIRRNLSARCEFSIRKIDGTFYLGNDLFLLDVTNDQLLYYIEGNYNYREGALPTVNYYVLHVNNVVFQDSNKLVNKIITKDIIPVWAQQKVIHTFSDGVKPIKIAIHSPELMEPTLSNSDLKDALATPVGTEESINVFLHEVSDKLNIGEYYTTITT